MQFYSLFLMLATTLALAVPTVGFVTQPTNVAQAADEDTSHHSESDDTATTEESDRQSRNARTHEIKISAVRIDSEKLAYKMESYEIVQNGESTDITDKYPDGATIPGPTIVLREGDRVELTLTNDIGEGIVSIHPHGIHYEITSDGTYQVINGESDQGAADGDSIEYEWEAGEGTAGTWPYHDHMFGTINGAEAKGLFGTIIVNPASNKVDALVDGGADEISVNDISKEFVMFVTDDAFWANEISGGEHTALWTNPTLVAASNEYVRFHLIALGTDFHEFELENYEWLDPGTDDAINTKTIGPLEITYL